MSGEAMNRRAFLQSSAAGLAAGAAVSLIGTGAMGANDKIVVGFMGLGGRGTQLLGYVAPRKDAEIAYVADPDARRLAAPARATEKLTGKKPKEVADFRTILDDKAVDVLFNATPDHWHVLPVILACQAGKDAYVEKPLSHNVWEGRQAVKAARKHNRVVQVGLQNRSAPYCTAAIEYLRSGKLGDVHLVRVLNMKTRGRIGPKPDAEPPKGVDYDLWLGPAPKRPFNPNHFHGGWYWFWDFSGGDIVCDGVHQMDIARWLIGRGLPRSVVSTGGKHFFDDAQDCPDTQHVHYDYGDLTMTFELTLWTPYMKKTPWAMRDTDEFPNWTFNGTRVELYGTKGLMILGRHGGGWQAWDADWKLIGEKPGRQAYLEHIENLFQCIRSRKRPNADVEEGHLSAALCHIANISQRCGGRKLAFDPDKEQFPGDAEAGQLLKRPGRPPYTIPEEV